MKTISLSLYSFDELSKDVQDGIVENERWNIVEQSMDCYNTDYRSTLKAFEKLTGTMACNWHVGYEGYNFDLGFRNPMIYVYEYDWIRADDVRGKLLFRYINNNIMPHITKGRYYSKGKWVDDKYQYKSRYSKILLENDGYPLTGMCYDQDILAPIIRYYETWARYPADFSLTDLMRLCYDSFFDRWHKEYEHWADDEVVREELRNNQYHDRLYYEDGKVYGECV